MGKGSSDQQALGFVWERPEGAAETCELRRKQAASRAFGGRVEGHERAIGPVAIGKALGSFA